MKPSSFLLLTLMVFFLYSDVAVKAFAAKHCEGYPKVRCNEGYLAHCGSDGKTYSSRCHFCNEYILKKRKLALMHIGKCRKV